MPSAPDWFPRVSIIIPVYNGSNYLSLAIESALAQTYENIEVIVVNDGSTDDGATETIAKKYADKIIYIFKQNGGVSSALNLGIARMSGEFFSWLSHDDIFHPDKTKIQISYLKDHPDFEVLGSGHEVIDNKGTIRSIFTFDKPLDIINGRGAMDTWIYGCSLLIRKDVFDRVGCFNESNRTVQDLEMWLNIVNSGFVIRLIPNVLCQWRQHGESGSFSLRGAHLKEVDGFLLRISKKYPFVFFEKDPQHEVHEPLSDVYAWFANQALERGCVSRSRKFFLASLGATSILDPRFWKTLRNYFQTYWAAARRIIFG